MCEYYDKEFDAGSKCEKHEYSCKKQKKYTKSKIISCYRCGRIGHYSTNCYAKNDIDGHELDSE